MRIEACGRAIECESGGYSIEWDDGRCDLACSSADASFEKTVPTPLAQGSRHIRRLSVTNMRRGAVRQLLGAAVSEVAQDQEFIDLALEDVSVAQVIAILEQQ